MAKIVIYSKQICPFCVRAKQLLAAKGAEYIEHMVDTNAELLEEMLQKSNGARTVPQIFINERHIGGFSELQALQEQGELDQLLQN